MTFIIDSNKDIQVVLNNFKESKDIYIKEGVDYKLFYKGSTFFLNKIIKNLNDNKIASIEADLCQFDYGFFIFYFKDRLYLYNDIHGAYPIFIYEETKRKSIILSDNIKKLKNYVGLDFNQQNIFDFYLFHHSVSNSTPYSNIKRLEGARKIHINLNEYTVESLGVLESVFNTAQKKQETVKTIDDYINNSIDLSNKTFLTLTGGFDSRLLLGVMLAQARDFQTATWGITGNLQTVFAKDLSKQFELEHTEVDLDTAFQNNLEGYIKQIYEITPESPFILDMPQFIHFSKKMYEKNGKTDIVTGFMGSEIIRSPSYSSEVLLTKFAADISNIQTHQDLKKLIYTKLSHSSLFREDAIHSVIDQLAERYKVYTRIENKNNENIANYLFKEKYAKVYAQIIKLHTANNINLINPYLSADFFGPFVKNNFLGKPKDLYNTSTIENFYAYKRYAEIMNKSFPAILKTKVDKGGYNIADLLTPVGISKIILKKYLVFNKKARTRKYSPVFNYQKWYKPFIFDSFKDPNNYIFESIDYKKLHVLLSKYDQLDFVSQNNIIVLLGLYLSEKFNK